MTLWKNLVVALVAAFALAACSSSSDTAAPTPPDPGPSAYDMALHAIDAATTDTAVQAAVDEAEGDVTGAELRELEAAADARMEELETRNRADAQKMALMTAAGMIDTSDLSTQEAVNVANAAIAALKAALAMAADVSDADEAMYQGRVTAAETAVEMAQSALDHDAQTMALTGAVEALEAIDLGDLSSEEDITAANAAIAALRTALDMATELSDAEKTAAMTLVATANRTVMAAQGRMDVAGQKMALADAVGALDAINLDNLMTQAQIDAANAAIAALDLALDAADDLTDAEKLDALTDVTVAKREVAAAEMVLAENVGDQRMALSEAGTALGAIDLADLDTAEKIAAANEAVEALKMALANATHLSDAAKAMYQTQLDAATETVRMAQTGMDRDGRMTAQRTAITNAVAMARTAVAGVSDTSTDSEVASADAAVKAVKDAIGAAEDLSEDAAEIIGAMAVLETIEPLLANAKTSRMAYLEKKGDDNAKTMAATGKALYAALAGPAGDGTDNALAAIAGATNITSAGLVLPIAENPGTLTQTAASVTLEAGDSAGALGSWNGMDYTHSTGTGDDKVTNEARVYTNQGAPTTRPFVSVGDNNGKYTLVDGALNVDGSTHPVTLVMAAAFTHSGTETHAIPEGRTWLTVRGTYDGAPGEFRCAATGPSCTSTNNGSGSPSALGGTWTFKPDTGAMVSQPDANYLYYGWWVSNDSKDMPTAASAFVGKMGVFNDDGGGAETPLAGVEGITGSATYAGNAAGKFAINNPLDGTGSGGHFTADATLTATFGGGTPAPANPGVTGTIDNFRLNDGSEDPGWSVALALGAIETDGEISAPAANPTVWSINGNKANAGGTWSGQMYDEKPGVRSATGPGDGSNIPTTVTGTFYSEFSTIGRMVGAFGADKQ